MNAEQKRRAERILSEWHDGKYSAARHGVEMASLLHELVDAAEPSTNDMPILVSAEYSQAEVDYSMAWIANNPALFDKSFNEFAAKCKASGWRMTSASRDGFISIIGSPARDPAQSVPDGHVHVQVSGLSGSGKSAVAGEIEIALRTIGLDVEWVDSESEKRLTHADYVSALELYKPKVRIFEKNIPRATPTPAEPSTDLPSWENGDDPLVSGGLINRGVVDFVTLGVWSDKSALSVSDDVAHELTPAEPPADVVRDAERYRWLLENARATAEHWGGRWSLVIDSPAPGKDASSEAINAAIDAAIKRQGGE